MWRSNRLITVEVLWFGKTHVFASLEGRSWRGLEKPGSFSVPMELQDFLLSNLPKQLYIFTCAVELKHCDSLSHRKLFEQHQIGIEMIYSKSKNVYAHQCLFYLLLLTTTYLKLCKGKELYLQVRLLICYNFISTSALKLHHYFKLFLTVRNFMLLLMS